MSKRVVLTVVYDLFLIFAVMYTSEYVSRLCDYYGIPDRQITVFDHGCS